MSVTLDRGGLSDEGGELEGALCWDESDRDLLLSSAFSIKGDIWG